VKSYLYLAYEALRHQIGISIPTSDPQRLRTLLYKEREGIPELSSLEFRLSPRNPDGELWITHRPAKNDPPKANSGAN
jgi:hypothetical protein